MKFDKLICLLLLVILGLSGCRNNDQPDMSDIIVDDVKIKRFDSIINVLDKSELASELERLKGEYPLLITGETSDSNYIGIMRTFLNDTLNRMLMSDVNKSLRTMSDENKLLTDMFRRVKYYIPDFKQPEVITYISGLTFENPVLFNGTDLFIGTDCFLGSDYFLYKRQQIPLYIVRKMTRDNILRECALSVFSYYYPALSPRSSLIEQMEYYGKMLYFVKLVCPELKNYEVVGYTSGEYDWCKQNEGNIWMSLVQNDLLFSKDYRKIRDYITDAPFTKGIPKDSPGRVGQWVGYQIVLSYMEKSGVTFQQLMQQNDAGKILKISGYKPRV